MQHASTLIIIKSSAEASLSRGSKSKLSLATILKILTEPLIRHQ